MQIARFIHCLAINVGYENYNHVSNALVDLYGKKGDFDSVIKIFNDLPNKYVVSWTCIISSFSRNGYSGEEIKLFISMRMTEIYMDEVLCSRVLGECDVITIMKLGKKIHATVIKEGCSSSLLLNNALIELLFKMLMHRISNKLLSCNAKTISFFLDNNDRWLCTKRSSIGIDKNPRENARKWDQTRFSFLSWVIVCL